MNKLSHKEIMESLGDTYATHYQYFPEIFHHESFASNYYTGTFLNESLLDKLENYEGAICHLGDYWPPDR